MHWLFLAAVLITSPIAQSKQPQAPAAHVDQQPSSNQRGSQLSPLIVHEDRRPQSEPEAAYTKDQSKEDESIKHWEIGLSFAVAVATIAQAFFSLAQVRIYRAQSRLMLTAIRLNKRSADAALGSANASLQAVNAQQKLERPFLIIETRGPRNTDFWAVNHGKTPAQIIWMNPVPIVEWPRWDEEMPQEPNYGLNYYESGVEILNVQWIAPGKDMRVGTFDPEIVELLDPTVRAELNGGTRRFYIYSAVKYRGVLSDTCFESRYCYGWRKDHGTYMKGPYGYNKNT